MQLTLETGLMSSCALQERDWGDSSAEEDDPDPREQLWATFLAHNPQQQLQTSEGGQQPPASCSAAPMPLAQQGAAWDAGQTGAGGSVVHAAGPGGAQAAVLALTAAATAAAGGPRLRASTAQEPLAPGAMLAQAPAGEREGT